MVGKSDFNENPVVSLDLDLDFDLGFVNFFVIWIPLRVATEMITEVSANRFIDL